MIHDLLEKRILVPFRSAIRHGTLVLAAAAVLVAGTAQGGTIILDTFTNGSWAVGASGRTPDTTDLPGSKWTGPEGYWSGTYPTALVGGRLKVWIEEGYTLPIGSYTLPTKLRLSADLTVNKLDGVTSTGRARGITVGLTDQAWSNTDNPVYPHLTGLDLQRNGTLTLFDHQATIASVAWAGTATFDPTQSYHLSYELDTSSGQISNIQLAGSTANYSSLQVSRNSLKTPYAAAVYFNAAVSGQTLPESFGYLDNFKVEEVTTEVSTSLTLESSGNPSLEGSSVTFTATVQAGGVTATGAGGTVVFKDGSTELDTITVSSGMATYSTSALAGGSHPITAEYSGVTGYFGSSSSSVLNQLVKGPATVLVFTTAPNSAYAGSAFGTQPVVKTRDSYGNDSTFGLAASEIVTIAIMSGTGTLGGTFTYDIGTAAGNGTITGSGLAIDTAGSFTLGAASANLTEGESTSFTVQAADANRLLNPSFHGNATGWTLSGVMYEDNDTIPGGQDSLKRCIRMNSSGGTLTQTVTLAAGNYALTAWFATNTSNTAVFELRDSGNVAVTPSASSSPTIPVQPSWVQWQRNYTNLTAGSYTVYVRSSANAVWADNFSLTLTPPLSSACDLVSFNSGSYVGTINQSAQTVSLVVPYFTDLTTLEPVCTASLAATISPTGAQDFSDSVATPVEYTVTAEDGETQKTYAVTVTNNSTILWNPSFYGNATGWTLSGAMYEDNDTVPGGQDSLKRCIRMYSSGGTLTQTVTLPAGNYTLAGWFATNTSNTAVFELRDSGNVAVTPSASSSPTIPVQPSWVQWKRNYTGLAAGSYTVYVRSSGNAVWADHFSLVPREAFSSECDMVSFDWGTSIGVITPGSPNTVSLVVPAGTDLSALTPSVGVSAAASFAPSGAQDFTNSATTPVSYTVTAEDGIASKVYQVTVTLEAGAGYGAWASANGASANPLEDSNHNGVPNSVEYFMGGTLASPATLPPLADNAGTWTWTIPYDPAAAATYLFQVSGDLSGWTDVLSGIEVLTGPDQLRVTLPSGMRFCRLLVTTP